VKNKAEVEFDFSQDDSNSELTLIIKCRTMQFTREEYVEALESFIELLIDETMPYLPPKNSTEMH